MAKVFKAQGFKQTVYKWRKLKSIGTLPRSGLSTKMTPKTSHAMVCRVAEELMLLLSSYRPLSHCLMFMNLP